MMNFDEFQESDLIFSDYSSDQSVESNNEDDDNDNIFHNRKHYNNLTHGSNSKPMKLKSRKNIPKTQRKVINSRSSIPINIPSSVENSFRYNDDDVACFGLFDEEYDDDDGVEEVIMRLPPHLIVERRVCGEIARSFSPLNGRNLFDVRDSILRLTGFLER